MHYNYSAITTNWKLDIYKLELKVLHYFKVFVLLNFVNLFTYCQNLPLEILSFIEA